MNSNQLGSLLGTAGVQVNESAIDVSMALNEVYHGRRAVEAIRAAMEECRQEIMDNPGVNWYYKSNTTNSKLERAIGAVFKTNRVSIFWSNDVTLGDNNNVRACLGTKIGKRNKMNDTNFNSNKGARLDDYSIVIMMSKVLFTDIDLTADEAVAILLHEIGHCMDDTIAAAILPWYNFAYHLLTSDAGIIHTMCNIITGTATIAILRAAPELVAAVTSFKDFVLTIIPPVGTIVRAIQRPYFEIIKLLAYGDRFSAIGALGSTYMFIPLRYIGSAPAANMEMYADSFAAQYGYGPELASGLHKLKEYVTAPKYIKDPFGIMEDIAYTQMSIIMALSGDCHGDDIKRVHNMIATIETELNDPYLPPAIRAEATEQLEELKETYTALTTMDKDTRHKCSTIINKALGNYYDKKRDILGDGYISLHRPK